MFWNTENPKCSVEIARRPNIKLPPGSPQIIICMPIGPKQEAHLLEIPSCEVEGCKCPNHGRKMKRQVLGLEGHVSFEFAMSQQSWVTPLNATLGYLAEKGKLSGPARNDMTIRAMELGCKYIAYVDDDVILHPHALYDMHVTMETHPDIGLLTGVVCTREDPTEPLVYKEQGRGAYWGFSIDPNAHPEDIWAAGGGCLIARVEALKAMTPPYWADVRGGEHDPTQPGNAVWGHDVYFINKLRIQSGMRTCVKGSILCGHWDVEKQKLYELPKDSLPYQNQQHVIPKPHVMGVETCPPLTVGYVSDQLRFTEYGRRMFIVDKTAQSAKSIRQVLSLFFKNVKVVGVEGQWIGIGEGLKDANQPISGDSPGDHQLGDTSSNSGRSRRSRRRIATRSSSSEPGGEGPDSTTVATLDPEGNHREH